MNDIVERRDFLKYGLALGSAVAATTAANAQAALPAHRLTLHVLDVYSGKPGNNVRVDVSVLEGASYRLLKTVQTTPSGRPAAPVLADDDLKVGEYELLFYVDDYYSGLGVKLPNPAFLKKVPVRFSIFEPNAYHIPLLLTPWSYSTYRGS
jgi:5-hydroxyisourate hydrolase